MALPEEKVRYSYADYRNWDESVRVELIDGVVYDMSPAPSRRHQEILREFSTEFSQFFRDKSCEVYFAPFDVRLFGENKDDKDVLDVVQPDLSVICDKSKLDDHGCNGSPDFILEILSPSNPNYDRWKKYKTYEKAGVHEYWIVDPFYETVEVFLLEKGLYRLSGVFSKEDVVTVNVVEGLEIELCKVFL